MGSTPNAVWVHVAGPVELEPALVDGEVLIREVQRCLRCDGVLRAGSGPRLKVTRPLEVGAVVDDPAVVCVR